MSDLYDASDRQFIETGIHELRAQAEAFLADHGYPVNDRYCQLVGMYFQTLPPKQDYFFADELDMYIRKQEIAEAAFFLINPKQYKQLKELEAKEAGEAQQPTVQGTSEEVVPETKA